MSANTAEDRTLLALLAVFDPARATKLAAYVAVRESVDLVEEAGRVAAASRRDRLAALTESLASSGVEVIFHEAVEALACEERPRPAAAIRALRDRHGRAHPGDGSHVTLRRLLHERLARTAGSSAPGGAARRTPPPGFDRESRPGRLRHDP